MKLIVTIGLTLVFLNVAFGQSETPQKVCRVNSQIFAVGESVGIVIDGCNNCVCQDTWFACPRMGCPGLQPLDCQIHGQQYKHYDSIPSDDCVECRCMNGNLACAGCTA